MKRTFAVLAAALLPALAAAETSTWSIDPAHSSSSFSVKHLVITTVRGNFGKTTGTIKIDDSDVTKSSVDAVIDASTIDTRVEKRDNDLKSAHFFDVAKYPTITFKSTKVEKAGGDDRLKVTGDLTIKGTTKPATLDVTYTPKSIKGTRGEERRAFSAATRINRREYGLNYSQMVEAGPVVGDQVKIEIEIEAFRNGEKSQANAATDKEKEKT